MTQNAQTPITVPIKIHFRTELTAEVTVTIDSPSKLLETQRYYGRFGWTSGEVPAGGYLFPYDNADDFDWSLIGAREWVNSDGESVIIHRGHVYKRREMEAVDSKKMTLPACVKYSRGAKPTDPAHIREKGDGDIDVRRIAA